jgi:hypothetical protein
MSRPIMRNLAPQGCKSFAPVIVNGDCRGHILRSAKGFRTFDRDDREIGTFASPDAGIAALLELAVA